MSEEISAKSFFLLLWVVGAAILAWRAGTLKYLPAALVVSAQECTCANWPLHSSIIKLWALHSAPLLSIVGLPPAKNKLNAPQFPKVHIIICFIETLQELQMSLRFMVCGLGGTPPPVCGKFLQRIPQKRLWHPPKRQMEKISPTILL